MSQYNMESVEAGVYLDSLERERTRPNKGPTYIREGDSFDGERWTIGNLYFYGRLAAEQEAARYYNLCQSDSVLYVQTLEQKYAQKPKETTVANTKDHYNGTLFYIGGNSFQSKIYAIREARSYYNMGLKEAKDYVDGLQRKWEAITDVTTEHIRKILGNLGNSILNTPASHPNELRIALLKEITLILKEIEQPIPF